MKVSMQVGEPRDFSSWDGSNTAVGTVVEGLEGSKTLETEATVANIIQSKGEKKTEEKTEYWFVVSCRETRYGDSTFSSLLMVPRYRLKKPPLDLIKEGQQLVFNAVWRGDGKPWDKGSVEAAQVGEIDLKGVLVVNIEKLDGE
ncbi:MAG: hypothetical protein ACE5GY_04125 [Thermodesulfobacteriota bacterium]